MTGLRIREGLDRKRLIEVTGLPLDDLVDAAALQRCLDAGLLESDGDILYATETGLLTLNAMLAHLLAPPEDGLS